MESKKRIIAWIMLISLVIAGMNTSETGRKKGAAAEQAGLSSPVIKDGVTTWDTVYFGSYMQSNDASKAPIKWRVLSVDGDDVFLLADKNIDCKPYNAVEANVTWETSTLRNWLNTEFYDEAFNADEKTAIRETMVVNDDNPDYGTEGGNNTVDKVYLLSGTEVKNESYGFSTAKALEAQYTDYAKAKIKAFNLSSWWLRSPGSAGNAALVITWIGVVVPYGFYAHYTENAVRPALHINLSSSAWKYAGKVNSNDVTAYQPSDTDASKPVPEPTKGPDNSVKLTANKNLSISSVKCLKNTKKITGRVSVPKASVKIKVGKKVYKKASVKGRRFTLKLNTKLKKKTKITVKVTRKGYSDVVKSYKVK